MQRKLELALKSLIAATFFVPLIVVPSSYIFPFIVPKIVWFRSLSLIMLGCYIVLLASNWKKYRPQLSKTNVAVFLFFVSMTVSTFVGVDWYKSFWDNHERMLGLFTVFHFVLYYYVITSSIKEWRDWKWLLRIFLFTGSIVMFIGMLQKFNPELLLNRGGVRVSATLGNAIYFSGYGLFLFFVGLLLFLKDRISGEAKFWQYYALVGGLIGLWGIFGGDTRGTLLGLIAGIVVLLSIYSMALKDHKKVRIGIVACLLGLVAIGGLLFALRENKMVQSIPAIGRLLTTDFTIKDSKVPRIMAWKIAIEAWQEKPVFGWGPNNYFYAFNKYYKPEFLESGWGETWFDNAHNIILNTMAVQGVVGIVLYVGMFGAGFFALVFAYKKGKVDKHVLAIGSAFLAGHFVHNITVFADPTSYLYFFFFLAFINQMTDNRQQNSDNRQQNRNISTGLTVVVGLVVLLLIYSTNINPARANNATLDAIRNLYSNPKLAMENFNIAIGTPSPHIDDIRNDFTRTANDALSQMMQNGKMTEEAKALFDLSYSELQKNRSLHPLDIRINLQLAQLGMTGLQLKKDQKFLFEAEAVLDHALILSPKRQQIQYMLAPLKLQLGKTNEAIQMMRDSINNDMIISDGWWRLAAMYSNLGDINSARSVMLEARQKGVIFDGTGKEVENNLLGKVID